MSFIKIDLKWSLWTTDVDIWADRADDALKRLRELAPGDRVTIYTCPKKEIRYGQVIVDRTPEGYSAEATFHDEWDPHEDNICDMARGHHLEDEQLRDLVQEAPNTDEGEPGVSVKETVSATTFEELLEKVDKVEGKLIQESEAAYDQLAHRVRRTVGIE